MTKRFLRHFWMILGIALIFAAGLCAGAANAQVSNNGQISGTVFDPSGKTIPGAQVTVTNPSTSFMKTVKASATGSYVFPELQPGTYTVSATADGFSKTIIDSVVVQVAQTTDLPIKMAIGTQTQTVTVTATPVLQTTQSTLATTISPALMEELPLNGRDVLQFATLAPGSANTGIHGNNYNTYNDLPNAAVNISISGTTDQFQRYKTFSSSFWDVAPAREGAFEEATVSTAGLDAANGSAGSQVQFAVKRGTSHYHGRGFWQAENSFFNANDWTNNAQGIAMPKSRNNFYGGNLGGPLLPKSLVGNHNVYFFVNLEYNKVPSAFSTHNLTLTGDTSGPAATAADCNNSGIGAANGCYTYEVTAIPATPPSWATCSASTMTCTANLYALAAAKGFPTAEDTSVGNILGGIAGFYKNGSLVPLSSTVAGLQSANAFYLQRLNYTITQPTTVWYPTTRLDVDITSKVHWMDSWDLEDSKTPSYGDWPGSPFVGNYTGFNNTYYNWTNEVTWTISPTLINTATFGILGTEEVYTPGAQPTGFTQSPVDGVPSQIEMPFGIPNLVPGVAEEVPRDNPVYNPSDTLRWTHGNHNFYLGGAIYYSKMREQQWVFPGVPDYTTGIANGDPAAAMFSTTNFPNMNNAPSVTTGITSQAAAENLYALLTGRVTSVGGGTEVNPATGQFQPGFGYTAHEAKTAAAIYFQDSWHMTPHLTMNYGLRWQLTGAIHNTDGQYFSASPQNLLGPSSSLFQPGTLNGIQNPFIAVNEHPYNGDFIQPSPNLGFAWNPDYSEGFLGKLFGGSKTVFRASYTINQYDEGWNTFENNTVYSGAGYAQYLNYSVARGSFAPGSLSLSTPGIFGAVQATATPPSYQTALPESTYTFFPCYPVCLGGINQNLKEPYIQQWTLGIQRELAGSTVLEIDYVGNHAVHQWQNYNINETNTLNNSFASQFKTAQANLMANSNANFSDSGPGDSPTPIFDAAFSGNGITTAANDAGGYANPNFITLLQQGQAGGMATSFVHTQSYICNLIGANFSPCGNAGGSYPINLLQANPYLTGGAEYLSNPGSSTYNGLQISVRHPTGHGLTLGGNYSFSKGLTSRFLSYWTDTAGEDFISLRSPGLNKGPSDYDIRHVFHTYFTYALPLGRGRMFNVNNSILNGVVGGWNVGSIISWQSGIPFWVQGGYSPFNNEDGGVTLNGVNASQIQKNIGVYITPASPFAPEWLNPSFNATGAIQPNTNPGTIGQMLFLHGPGFFNTDISLNKMFPIWESVSLKVQASFLNAFNHPNWIVGSNGAPGYIVYAAYSLGQPITSYQGNPRVIQFRTEIDF